MSARIRTLRPPAALIVAVLVGLGVAASALLVFSQSAQMLRIGVVVGLWTAVLGAFAMVRYRRESLADRARLADLQKVYELELDREIAARREFENRLRGEAGGDVRVGDVGVGGVRLGDVAALRAELSALRAGLEALLDGNLPVERVALRAEMTRVQELTTAAFKNFQPSASGLLVPDGMPPAPQFGAEVTDRPQFAGPNDDPVTVETAVVSFESESVVTTAGSVVAESVVAESVVTQSVSAESVSAESVGVGAESSPNGSAEAAEIASIGLDSPRRRRRMGEVGAVPERGDGSHSEGLSVAQIMANLRAERAGA